MANFGLKSIFFASWARVEVDDLVGGMLRLLGTSEELSRKEFEMVANWQHVRLRVKVVNCRPIVATSHEPKGTVLDQLEPTNGGL